MSRDPTCSSPALTNLCVRNDFTMISGWKARCGTIYVRGDDVAQKHINMQTDTNNTCTCHAPVMGMRTDEARLTFVTITYLHRFLPLNAATSVGDRCGKCVVGMSNAGYDVRVERVMGMLVSSKSMSSGRVRGNVLYCAGTSLVVRGSGVDTGEDVDEIVPDERFDQSQPERLRANGPV